MDESRDQLTAELDQVKIEIQQEIAERKRAEVEAHRREIQARLIHDVSQRVSSELELEELFSAIVTAIFDAFGYDCVTLELVDEDSQNLIFKSVAGVFSDIFIEGGHIAMGEGMTGYAAVSGETQLSGDVSKDPHYIQFADEITRSELVVPIKSGKKVIGVIDLQSEEFDAFDQTDVMLMETLADQVAVAMENAKLYEQAQLEIQDRKRVEAELQKHQEQLEDRVEERTSALKASEESYRNLFDGVPIGLYRTTPGGQILDANPALVDMYGFPSRKELLVSNMKKIYVDPAERLKWKKLMESKGVVRDFVARIKRNDGTEIWINDTARAIMDDRGSVLHYEGSIEDITERKLAEVQLLEYQEHLKELVDERTSELKASEERYRTLFDGVPIGLYRSTPEGHIVDINQAMVELFKFPSKDEALQTTTKEVYVNFEDRTRWQALMEQEGTVRDYEVQVRRYDGEIIWISDTARVVKDEDGNVLFYEGSVKNISERKKFEEEIRRQKDYFESLFLNSPVAIVVADLGANVVSWNPKAEKLFGYSQEEAIGNNVDDLVAKSPVVHEEAEILTNKLRDLERVQLTTKRTRKDGSLVDVDVFGLPLVLAGEKVGFYGMYHDISELKRIERELRQQKDYFEALFINSPVAIMTGDLDAKIVSWNPMAEKMFGYSQEEAIGENIDDLVATDPRIREDACTFTQELFTTDRIQTTGQRNRKDGSFVDVDILVLPVIVAGEKVGYVAIYYDISELLQARREAETANQAKSTFLANMSHELRTPLNAILGFTQLMEGDSNLTSDQQDNLEIINKSGEHLLALINDVLEMSKIEAGQVRLRQTTFDFHYLLDSLEEMFSHQSEKKGLELSFDINGEAPRYVISDEGKLRQVLNNLIGNAIKFTQEGNIKMAVTAQPVSSEEVELTFDVFDTGPGIPPEDLETVFDPFVQAADPTEFAAAQSPEGTGLGLSISRKFVRLMGGEITVHSELGIGSHFNFSVVVGISKDRDVSVTQMKRKVIGLAPGQQAFRLLVAEDRDTNRQLLVKLLERLGFEVYEAANGQEAIDGWQRWNPHLIWMDMRMPVMNGLEATRKIKSMPGGQSVSIIALTATAFDEDREHILKAGCDDFVRKPFRKNKILDILEKHLGARFIYEKEEDKIVEPQEESTTEQLKVVQALAAVPQEWIEELCAATLRADLHRILELANTICEAHPDLGRVLTYLAERFEYQKILRLIESSGDRNGLSE